MEAGSGLLAPLCFHHGLDGAIGHHLWILGRGGCGAHTRTLDEVSE